MQNWCMRLSFNIGYREHITPHLNEHKTLNMFYRRKQHMYCFIYRIISTGKPSYLKEKFKPSLRVDLGLQRNLNRQYFVVPRHRTACYQKSFNYVAVKMWNGLPQNVKNLKFSAFKALLVTFKVISRSTFFS